MKVQALKETSRSFACAVRPVASTPIRVYCGICPPTWVLRSSS